MTKLRKTSKTKLHDEVANVGSGKTILQPEINDNKATSVSDLTGSRPVATEEDIRIRQAFVDKDWNEIKIADSWQIFKVMSEFVEGFDKLSKIGPCVSIFGSARTKPRQSVLPDGRRNCRQTGTPRLRRNYGRWSGHYGSRK
jgi:hypothetical protein